ncbi:MAG: thiolase family protein [Burkholderiaceae bacterium]
MTDGVREAVVAGYAELPNEIGSGRSAYELAGEVTSALLQRMALEAGDIDGMALTISLSEATNPFYPSDMCVALGIAPQWLTLSALGGCSALSGLASAVAAVDRGACRIALVLSADAPTTVRRGFAAAWRDEFQAPQAAARPPAIFGLLMNRYAHQYGLDEDALAEIAVVQRRHAMLNDNALPRLRRPLSIDEYKASRLIADPLRMLDCVMFCDGANALLVASREEAARRGWPRTIVPLAYAEISNPRPADPCPDILETGFGALAERLFRQAKRQPADIGMFQPYDDFTIAVLLQMEQLGFCERGAGAAYVRATDLSYSGTLPLNTGGGQISAGQPGMAGGGVNLIEAVRQLFGEAGERQAKQRTALVTGIGTIPYGRNWTTSNAMILEAR